MSIICLFYSEIDVQGCNLISWFSPPLYLWLIVGKHQRGISFISTPLRWVTIFETISFEGPEEGDPDPHQLANIFIWCAICRVGSPQNPSEDVVCSLAKELRNFCPSAKWSFCLFAVSCQRDRYWFQEDEMNTRVVDSWVLLSLWPKSERFIGRQSIRLLLFGELCRLFFTSDF